MEKMRRVLLALLAISVILASLLSVGAVVDTSEYTQLQTTIAQKEAELEQANVNAQFGTAYSLHEELKTLRAQLTGPRMEYLKEYKYVQEFMTKVQDLFNEVVRDFSGSDLAVEKEASMAAVQELMAQSEQAYNEGDYAAAKTVIYDARVKLASAYSSSVVLATERISRAEQKLKDANFLSPSRRAMLDEARGLLNEARTLFERCRESWLSQAQDANKVCRSAYDKVTEALELIDRAIESPEPVEDILRWALLIVPIVLVVGLVLFFYRKLGEVAITASLSRIEVAAHKRTEVRRTIVVSNLEKKQISATIADSLPKALKVSTLYTEPQEQEGNKLYWSVKLEPQERKEISYTFIVPALEAGWPIKISPAVMIYKKGKDVKKFSSEEAAIKVI